MAKKIWLPILPRNFGSDKIQRKQVRPSVRPPLRVSRGEISLTWITEKELKREIKYKEDEFRYKKNMKTLWLQWQCEASGHQDENEWQ